MSELTSSMPPIEQVREEHTMKMERIVVQNFPHQHVTTSLEQTNNKSGETEMCTGLLYTVQDERTKGYLPSKVWVAQDEIELDDGDHIGHGIEMMFYCTPSLPDPARPFKEGPMYVLIVRAPSGHTISYDVELRVFIDQIIYRGAVYYVFCFGESMHDQIVTGRDEDA